LDCGKEPTAYVGHPVWQADAASLCEEQVIWVTTVANDGTPQPNPVGFGYQDDKSILIYNMVNANRLSHIVDRPQVALHFEGDGGGGDIVILTGTAHLAADIHPAAREPGAPSQIR
jgi:PPOX class probable F420-dependent enzyme